MQIEDYRFGQIVIDGQTYRSDVIIFADRVDDSWWREKGHELAVADLQEVLANAPEVLIVGTGNYGRMEVLPETEQTLAEKGVKLIAQPTEAACQSYNQQVASGRRVIAALHLTC